MKILLTQGQEALVDEDDFVRLSTFKWFYYPGSPRSLTGYAMRNRRSYEEGGRGVIYMHRFILDAPQGSVVDHINGNGLDNRRTNLRLATHRQNCRNRRGAERTSTSSYLGVSWHKKGKKWVAFICERKDGRGVSTYLGLFSNEEDAARAYDAAARIRFGRFASLNFPVGQ